MGRADRRRWQSVSQGLFRGAGSVCRFPTVSLATDGCKRYLERRFYFNEKTEESIWVKPTMLAWEKVPVDSKEL